MGNLLTWLAFALFTGGVVGIISALINILVIRGFLVWCAKTHAHCPPLPPWEMTIKIIWLTVSIIMVIVSLLMITIFGVPLSL